MRRMSEPEARAQGLGPGISGGGLRLGQAPPISRLGPRAACKPRSRSASASGSRRSRPSGESEVIYYAMVERTRDLHIESIRPLLPPAILLEEQPLSEQASMTVSRAREEIVRILDGPDDRLLVVVGPCSIHDSAAGLDYGRRLKPLAY